MYGILVDVTRCRGCEQCVDACVSANGLDPIVAAADRATTRDGLSADRWCTVLGVDEGRFARVSCLHCLQPSCVDACLVGGLTKSPEGPVVYDPDKCIGCRYCMLACPFHIPRYEWAESLPYMRKCSMCFERLRQGDSPACVAACPNDALKFGERDALLELARTRMRREPGRYLPRIWGEHEFGGTSVMFLSDVDLSAMGWPTEGAEAIPELTRPLIEKTPFIGLSVCFGTWALSAIIERRNRLAGRSREDAPDGEDHRDA